MSDEKRPGALIGKAEEILTGMAAEVDVKIGELEARILVLESALKPFAKASDMFPLESFNDLDGLTLCHDWHPYTDHPELDVGDLRAAHAAYHGGKR